MAAPFNGGVLATAGGLVFAGDLTKHLTAYDAATGKQACMPFKMVDKTVAKS